MHPVTSTSQRKADVTTALGAPRWVWPVFVVAAVVALVVAGSVGGIAVAQQLSDPGAITRWGLPIATTLHHLSWSATVAALIFAAGILPRYAAGASRRRHNQPVDPNEPEHPAYSRVLVIAATGGVVWTLSSLAQVVFTYSDLAGMPLNSSAGFTSGLIDYMRSISIGQAWFAMTLIAAVVTSLVFSLRSPTALGWTAALGLGGVIPLALVGHSAAGDDHYAAVNSIGLHLLGVVIWVGGLLVLTLISAQLTGPVAVPARGKPAAAQPLIQVTLSRYSLLASLAIVTVAVSGVVNAQIRMDQWEQLLTPYGMIMLAKVLGTLLLGFIGLAHRQIVIPQLATGNQTPASGVRRLLWRLIAVEVVIMAAVMSLASVLGRTQPPVPDERPPGASPARIITGYDLPPELTFERYFTMWRLDWLWVAILVFLAAWYIRSLRTLARRGDRWSGLRTASWFVGLLILMWTTSGAPAIYANVLFSAHMVAHMTLAMIAPLFLVLGAPITLALRALPARRDGTKGPREWMLSIVNSGYGRFVTHPLFAAGNFAGSMLVFYYTPIFGFALDQHVGHELMNFHFLITGFLFASVMVGIDPLPHQQMYPLRLVLLLATMVFHAFIGVALTGSESLLEAAWWSSLGRDWGISAIEDQKIGGAFMWGIGEFPTVIMAIIVVFQWSRSDAKDARRRDRRAEQDGDAELEAWNQMYAQMASSGGEQHPRLPNTPMLSETHTSHTVRPRQDEKPRKDPS